MSFNFKQLLKENIQQTRRFLWESLGTLDEKARYKEKGVELPKLWDTLGKLSVENPNNAQYFVHFSQIEKVGINPQYSFKTPLGIYAYPLCAKFLKSFKVKELYAMDYPHVFILKFVGDPSRIYSIGDESSVYSNMNQKEYDIFTQKIENVIKSDNSYRIEPSDIYQYAESSKNQSFVGKLWNITRRISISGKDWGFILRNLGINGFVDSGEKLIHPGEPFQAVFFNYKDLEIINQFKNKNEESLSPNMEIKKLISYVIKLYKKGKRADENLIREINSIPDDIFDEVSKIPLPESFIKEFSNKLNWDNISRYQKLSESFIRKFQDKVNWFDISRYQTLSESFIREFQNKVHWVIISYYQTLSEEFIREFRDEVHWLDILQNKNISQEVKDKFKKEGNF